MIKIQVLSLALPRILAALRAALATRLRPSASALPSCTLKAMVPAHALLRAMSAPSEDDAANDAFARL